MGQRFSISTGSSDSSDSVSPFLDDYVKVKSQENYNTPLKINPKELHFPFEWKKKSSCTLQLSNNSDDYVAFKIKFTHRKKYSVRPNYIGVVLPRSTCVITVTMKGPIEAPLDMQCKDKIIIQSIVAKDETIIKDITSEMFYKDSGYEVEEYRLKIVYVAPPQ